MKKIASHGDKKKNQLNYQPSSSHGLKQHENQSSHKRPKSQASALAINSDEKSPQPHQSIDELSGITEINIKNNEGVDGIRKYGGLTNSQARMFVNKSLIDAKASNSKQKAKFEQSELNTNTVRKKASKEGLSKSSRKSKKHRAYRNKKSDEKPGTSDEALPINRSNSEKKLSSAVNEAQKSRRSSMNHGGNSQSKESKQTGNDRKL